MNVYQPATRWLFLVATSWCFLLTVIAQNKPDPGFEIVGHQARLQLFPSANAIACTDTVKIRRTSSENKIILRLLPIYEVEFLSVQGDQRKPQRVREGIEVHDLPSDSLVDIIIRYSGRLAFRSEFSLLTPDRAVLREEEILPSGPHALVFTRFSVVVPNGWDVIAVGKLVHQETLSDSSTFVWEFDQPIPQIGWICGGKFWKLHDEDGKVPLAAYLFPEDSGAGKNILQLTKNVVEDYGRKFLPYRFPMLHIVEIEDWVAGRGVLAIAVPGIIMMKKLAFTTEDRFNQAASVLPHEIAHQWWPATVFIEDQDAAFLSEGMCEYSALMYSETHGTMTRRDSLSTHPLLRALMIRIQQGKDLPLQQKADLRSLPTHYLKASYVHNMLRHILGDSAFVELYHQYANRFAMKKATLHDFQTIAEELSGKKLDWFFEQWIKKRGVPHIKIYNVKSAQAGGTWITRGRVRMLGYEKYTTQISVGVETSGGISQTTLMIGTDSVGMYHNDLPFEIQSTLKPTRAILDPQRDVLKVQKLPPKLGDLRDPADGIMIVGTLAAKEYLLGLARKDSIEMDHAGWSLTIKFDTEITLADLQQEHVILYGRAFENKVVADLEKKFPLGFRGDSVRLKNESIFDSTLALIQAIESPYVAQGMMYWVAPLSDKAMPNLLPFDDSWVLVRGKDEISSGTWEIKDEDAVVDIQ